MKALVADAINEKGIENLKEVCEVVVDTSITPEELLETIGEYDAILIRSRTKLPAEVIEKADNLKIIARAGVGVNRNAPSSSGRHLRRNIKNSHLDALIMQSLSILPMNVTRLILGWKKNRISGIMRVQ